MAEKTGRRFDQLRSSWLKTQHIDLSLYNFALLSSQLLPLVQESLGYLQLFTLKTHKHIPYYCRNFSVPLYIPCTWSTPPQSNLHYNCQAVNFHISKSSLHPCPLFPLHLTPFSIHCNFQASHQKDKVSEAEAPFLTYIQRVVQRSVQFGKLNLCAKRIYIFHHKGLDFF